MDIILDSTVHQHRMKCVFDFLCVCVQEKLHQNTLDELHAILHSKPLLTFIPSKALLECSSLHAYICLFLTTAEQKYQI